MNESELLQHLMRATNFTADDLASNRKGLITDRQVQTLKKRASASALRTAAVGFIFGAVMLAGGLVVNDVLLSLVFVGAGILFIPLVIVLAWLALRRSPVEVEVKAIEGEGRRGTAGGRYTFHWYYQIGDMRFEIPPPAHNVLVDGVIYRGYYAPSSKTLLSIEPKSLPKS